MTKLVCTECKKGIKKIVRVYESKDGETTIKAFFNTDGHRHVTYEYDSGGYPIGETESHFQWKLDHEGWKLLSENHIS